MHFSTIITLFLAASALANPVPPKKASSSSKKSSVVTKGTPLTSTVKVSHTSATSSHHTTTSIVARSTKAASSTSKVSSSTKRTSSSTHSSSSTLSTSTRSSSTSSKSSSASSTPTDFASTVTYQHNLHRSNHSAPSATYDSTLAGYASQVASSCTFAHNLSPGGGGYGQNIAAYGASGNVQAIGASTIIAQAITDFWYNNELNQFLPSYYGESTPDMSNFESWGHFSQVVWVGSTAVGCAAQYCAAGTLFSTLPGWFSVCNYGSAGNVGGEYGSNVLAPLGHATVTVNV